ncbi:lytic transglycosylase domain-containing protein [Brucella sp. BE17]|uniref:lytic transglycosylase domain-containing protein n=1 Tax=Brucella sp. BE17 TaxID=3142977 RepID=UPI0031BA04E7
MRFAPLLSSPGSLIRKALGLCVCAVALSACNTTTTTTDGKVAKTALIESGTSSTASNTTAADTADREDAGYQMVASLDNPALPAVGPVPGMREQSETLLAYAGGKTASPVSEAASLSVTTPAQAPKELDTLISQYSVAYDVPEQLVRRVVHRESRFNPAARNGPYYGLMQISHPTARGMGYKGSPKGLLDAETNLKYAVRYLSGAYKVADGNENQAVRFYARGYYYDAKRKGLLKETGLDGSFRKAAPPAVATDTTTASIQ